MMRDVMESAGFVIYAEIGLVLMLVAFLFVVARSLTRKSAHYQELAKLPLDDDFQPSGNTNVDARSSERSEV